MGPNRLPQFDYLYTLFTTELSGQYLLVLYVVLGMEIHYSWLHFCYQLLFIVHVEIIMLIGTWSDHPGKQCYHKGIMGRPWLTNQESQWKTTLPERGKGSRGEVSAGRSLVDFAAMAVSQEPCTGSSYKLQRVFGSQWNFVKASQCCPAALPRQRCMGFATPWQMGNMTCG